jgi:hypothetical protein
VHVDGRIVVEEGDLIGIDETVLAAQRAKPWRRLRPLALKRVLASHCHRESAQLLAALEPLLSPRGSVLRVRGVGHGVFEVELDRLAAGLRRLADRLRPVELGEIRR